MKPVSILITDRFTIEAQARLTSQAHFKVEKSASPKPTAMELAHCQGLIVRSRTRVDRALLAQAPELKVVVTATSGFEHIDLGACAERAIKVMYTPDANADSAAELTWALVLAGARRVIDSHRAVKSGEWRNTNLNYRQLRGQCHGIVGLGRIGSRVAKMAQAFGMRAVGFDPYIDDADFSRLNVTRMGLEELFKCADTMSVHVPATAETKHMFWRMHFADCNPGLFFVNTSRGAVVEEKILLEALDQKLLSGCALDVFETEPLPRHSGLNSRDNVILSPHVGASTPEALAAASVAAAEKTVQFFADGRITDPLPPNARWFQGGFIHALDTPS